MPTRCQRYTAFWWVDGRYPKSRTRMRSAVSRMSRSNMSDEGSACSAYRRQSCKSPQRVVQRPPPVLRGRVSLRRLHVHDSAAQACRHISRLLRRIQRYRRRVARCGEAAARAANTGACQRPHHNDARRHAAWCRTCVPAVKREWYQV